MGDCTTLLAFFRGITALKQRATSIGSMKKPAFRSQQSRKETRKTFLFLFCFVLFHLFIKDISDREYGKQSLTHGDDYMDGVPELSLISFVSAKSVSCCDCLLVTMCQLAVT